MSLDSGIRSRRSPGARLPQSASRLAFECVLRQPPGKLTIPQTSTLMTGKRSLAYCVVVTATLERTVLDMIRPPIAIDGREGGGAHS